MKILLVHNYYSCRGGEDIVFEQEKLMLERKGNQVIAFTRKNLDLNLRPWLDRPAAFLNMIWSQRAKAAISQILVRERPQVVHVHNTFGDISPSILSACREQKIPVIKTLHNFRLFCAAGTLFRQGSPCEECSIGTFAPAVLHGCYRNSRWASSGLTAMLWFHHWRKTWFREVESFITLSRFARNKFNQFGFPSKKLVVKPHSVFPDPGGPVAKEPFVLYAGRLSEEKGPGILLKAWETLPLSIPLKIAGSGPLEGQLKSRVKSRSISQIQFLGALPREQVIALMQKASLLIFPSLCYENFPMSIVEAFACGTPVLASRLGSMAEMVATGINGWHFEPGDANSLQERMLMAWSSPGGLTMAGRGARRDFEEHYTVERNYSQLIGIYEDSLRRSREET